MVHATALKIKPALRMKFLPRPRTQALEYATDALRQQRTTPHPKQ